MHLSGDFNRSASVVVVLSQRFRMIVAFRRCCRDFMLITESAVCLWLCCGSAVAPSSYKADLPVQVILNAEHAMNFVHNWVPMKRSCPRVLMLLGNPLSASTSSVWMHAEDGNRRQARVTCTQWQVELLCAMAHER